MIPISLTIKGIYSYRTEQTINFSNLARSGVFGIFGPVGSGKSAILDAIMFALYGETERLSKQDSRQYNMMNLQENEMSIDFIFRLSDVGGVYRFTVKARRNKKNFEKVESAERMAYKQNTDDSWLPISTNMAEQLLGVSYDNFKRTVIIPQGQCMEFIQMKPADRTRMMKELFLLDKFELSNATLTLEKENEAQRNMLRGRLQELGDYSENLILEAQQSLQNLQKGIAEIEQNLHVKTEQFKYQDAAYSINERFLVAQQKYNLLEQQLPSITIREQELSEYEWCKLHFAEILSRYSENEKKLQIQQHSLHATQQEIAKTTIDLQKTQDLLKNIEPKYLALPQRQRMVELLQTVGIVQQLAKEIAELDGRISKGQTKISETISELNICNADIELKKDEFATLKQAQPDIDALWQIRIKLDRLEIVELELDKTKKAIIDSEEKIRQLLLVKETVAKSVNLPFPLQPNSFEETESKFRTQIFSIEQQLEQISIKQQLHSLAGNLTDGEACPLCGATHHPSVYLSETVDQEQQQGKQQLDTIRKNIELLRDAQRELTNLDKEHSQIRKNEREHSAQLHPLAIERNCLQTEIIGHNKTQIADQLQLAQINKKKLETLEIEIENQQQLCNTLLTREKQYTQALQQIQSDCEAKRTAHKLHLQSLHGSDAFLYIEKTGEEVANAIKTTLQDIEQVKEQYEILSKQNTNLQTQIATYTGQQITLQSAVYQLENELKRNSIQLDETLEKSQYSTIDQVRNVIARNIDLSTERNLLQSFRQEYHHANQTLQILNTEQLKQPFDSIQYEQLKLQLQSIQTQHKEQLDILAQSKANLDALLLRAKTGALLTTQLQELELRAQNIKTLKGLFYASGFVNYVSTSYLHNLCLQANSRFFKLSKQKLQLEIDSENAFVVRDFMNNGQLRSIKTLSGGQTFQAALCLALALSDSVQQKHNNQQNFFFIDEGFGSLDKESLRLVFDTLNALRQENRIVGIISHVDDLKEEIPTFLQVQNIDEKGSFFIESCR